MILYVGTNDLSEKSIMRKQMWCYLKMFMKYLRIQKLCYQTSSGGLLTFVRASISSHRLITPYWYSNYPEFTIQYL